MLDFMYKEETFKVVGTVIMRTLGLFLLDYCYIVAFAHWADYLYLFQALILAFLPQKQLIALHKHLISGILLQIVYLSTYSYNMIHEEFPSMFNMWNNKIFITKTICEFLIPTIVAHIHKIQSWKRILLYIFSVPYMLRVIGMSRDTYDIVNSVTLLISIILILIYLFLTYINKSKFNILDIDFLYSNFNLKTSIDTLPTYIYSFKLTSKLAMACFWFAFFVKQIVVYKPTVGDHWLILSMKIIGDCTKTPLLKFALGVTISYVTHWIRLLIKLFLLGWTDFNADSHSGGMVEGLTILLLYLKGDVWNLMPRSVWPTLVVILLRAMTAFLHSIFELAEPILLVLGAGQNKNVFKHARALSLFAVLLICPLTMPLIVSNFLNVAYLYVAIASGCLHTVIQVFGTLVMYAMYVVLSILNEPWEYFDDVIYYIRSAVRICDILVAVFCLWFYLAAVIDLFYFVCYCFHVYFNIWVKIQESLTQIRKHRSTARAIIVSLPIASDEQLQTNNDVCPICRYVMTSTRITPCGHIFHGHCLKRWLYLHENCPMCHQNIQIVTPEDPTG